MKRMICLMTFLSFTVSEAHAQAGGNRQEGLVLAQTVCSECHAVQRGEVSSPNSRAPTFSELATAPGMTATALTVALTTPHAGMPMFQLTASQSEGVITYILSLR